MQRVSSINEIWEFYDNESEMLPKIRYMLFDANLNKEFWAEAVNTAVHLEIGILCVRQSEKALY